MKTASGLEKEEKDSEAFDAAFIDAVMGMDAAKVKLLVARDPEKARHLCLSNEFGMGPKSYFNPTQWTVAIQRGVSSLQNERAGERWVEAMDAMVAAGFDVRDKARSLWNYEVMSQGTSVAQMDWMLDHGGFDGLELELELELERGMERFAGRHSTHGLVASLAGDGPAEMKVLEKMARVGLVGGADRCANPSHYALAGLWGCAQKLMALGFKPGPCEPIPGGPMLDPIPAMLSSFSQRGSAHLRRRLAQSEAEAVAEAAPMLAAFECFVMLGAKLDLGRQHEREANPFFALMAGDSFVNERGPSLAMLDLLGPKLLAMGADPNAGGWVLCRWIGMQVENARRICGFDIPTVWNWVLSIGVDPCSHPGKALSWASGFGQEAGAGAMVDRLVAAGVDPARVGRLDLHSPVQSALENSLVDLAWKLVDLGAPLDFVDAHGETALHMAAGGDKKVSATLGRMLALAPMGKLVDAKSLAKSREGERPLHRACSALSHESMRLLLAAGADVNARDDKGWTPLRHLLRKFGSGAQKKIDPCLRLLLAHKADPSIADNKGRTPAQAVAGKAPMAAMEELLSLRPQDVAGDGAQALVAREVLGVRGARGRSLVEKVEIGAVAGCSPEATDYPDDVPIRKRRL